MVNRKKFLASLALSGFVMPGTLRSVPEDVLEIFKTPPYLKRGDKIGITAPAGAITAQECASAVGKFEEWGFQTVLGNTIGGKDFTFSGSDQERAMDFQAMLDDDSIRAVFCARGGYGCVRIIDSIDFKKFRSKPKWVAGFSDITVFHSHINSKLNIATLHSKMCNSFPDSWILASQIQIDTINSIRDCLMGTPRSYSAPGNAANRPGTASGFLVGGNLSTFEQLGGSVSELDTKNKILFLEDVDEYPHSIDRMMWNLKRAGKLDHLKGLIVGGVDTKTDPDDGPFGLALEQIVMEKVDRFSYPVCFDFPVGHQKNNYALKCGFRHGLTVKKDGAALHSLDKKTKPRNGL